MANPDLILYNGRIYLQPDRQSRVEAISITDGGVTATGSSRDLLRFKAASTNSVDLHGLVGVPGLADSHVHLLGYGMLLRTLDLSSARSIAEIQTMLAKVASGKPKDQWILGRGWDQEKLRDHRYPDRSDVDITTNPAFFRRICGHVAVANSTALAKAGVDENTPDPFGGEIERDSTGKPNGILKERALEIVSRSVPRHEKETREALLVASQKLLEQGVTSLHCIIEDDQEFKALKDLKHQGKIAQTIYAILPMNMLEQVASMEDELAVWGNGFRIGGIKLFLDGSLGARTAALGSPYDDAPGSSGMLTMSKEQLLSAIDKTRDTGLQLCLHAIGDRAVAMGVETLTETLGSRECQKSRHRIEHASLVPPELMRDMAELGLVASVQPRFIYSDSWAEKRLGKRVSYLYPFKSMIQAGIHLAAGSDSPSDDPSTAEGLWSAVSRPGLSSLERLTPSEALSCYTKGPAYASFSENVQGTLQVGKWANMTVLDHDPLESTPDALRKLRVVQTIVRGTIFSWN
ncbi:MAG TPA: amidohydrolase [Candidatus Bathyarchaeia archaeon]|nr:amidohydrolase [Candidatus Bathyarchaeia archaeon]